MARGSFYVQPGNTAATSLVAVAVVAITFFFVKLVGARRFIYRLRSKNLRMPEFSVFTGHLLLMRKQASRLPKDCTINTLFLDFYQQFSNGIFYFDLWPFSKPLMFVNTPSGAAQVEKIPLDKPGMVETAFQSLCGGPNLFTMPELVWKPWRQTFNPGFSASYMIELVPQIAAEAKVFSEILRQKAQESFEVTLLENLTLKLTVDVIMAVVMDTKLHYQKHDHPVAAGLRTHIEWTSFGADFNPFTRYNLLRPIILAWNSYRINRYIHAEIEKRFNELQLDKLSEDGFDKRRSKSIISLTLKNYLKEHGMEGAQKVDKDFMDIATAQLRLFLFAGHDTTSSTLCYCYHMLATNPNVITRVRTELDEVLGTDSSPSTIHNILNQDPHRLNELPYMLAVIKETLRLFPPASGIREGRPGINITDNDGKIYPTEGCIVWTMHLILQRNPKYWKEPNSFIPERWLVGPKDDLYPVKGAWRPFEFGPRNCLGQTMAILELKVVLAMTIRAFDIRPAYEEFDKTNKVMGIKTVLGNRAYQVEGGGGGAHPSDRYPCTIALRY